MWMVSGSIVSRLLFVSGHISFYDPVWAVEKIQAIEVGQEMPGTWILFLGAFKSKTTLMEEWVHDDLIVFIGL